MRLAFFALTALCLAGVYLSIELVSAHIGANYGGVGDTGLCQALEGFSCEAAARSDYSSLFGFPIAGIGGVFYVVMMVAAALARFNDNEEGRRHWQNVLVGGGLASVGYSIFLAYVSVTQLEKLCPLCMGLYGVNLGMLIAAAASHVDGFGGAFKGLFPTIFTSKATLAAAGLMVTGVIGGQAWYAGAAQAAKTAFQTQPAQPDKSFEMPTEGAPGKGPEDAKVVVVEFSDFECPYCGRLTDALKQAQANYKNVRIYFRHYPMDNACNPNIEREFHQHACEAAKAAVCAQKSGQFWPLHDWLFKNAKGLTPEKLQAQVAAIGLDPEAITQCMADPATVEQIKADIAAGDKIGVRGTPTFLVNGKVFVGGKTPEELEIIFAEAAKGKAAPSAPAQ
ncbi:MAG: vitamin K epoxide reductase family protein [Bradymonadia bacterium]